MRASDKDRRRCQIIHLALFISHGKATIESTVVEGGGTAVESEASTVTQILDLFL